MERLAGVVGVAAESVEVVLAGTGSQRSDLTEASVVAVVVGVVVPHAQRHDY